MHCPGAPSNISWESQHLSKPPKGLPNMIPKNPSIPLHLHLVPAEHIFQRTQIFLHNPHISLIYPSTSLDTQAYPWVPKNLHRSPKSIFQAPRNVPPAMKHLSGETIHRPWSAKHLPGYTSISLGNPSTFLEDPRSFLGYVSIFPCYLSTSRGTQAPPLAPQSPACASQLHPVSPKHLTVVTKQLSKEFNSRLGTLQHLHGEHRLLSAVPNHLLGHPSLPRGSEHFPREPGIFPGHMRFSPGCISIALKHTNTYLEHPNSP